MPRVAKSKANKVDGFIKEFPNEFTISYSGNLHCILCNTTVSHEKRFNVENHRSTVGHQRKLKPQTVQATLIPEKNDFAYQVCHAFLQADIPLWKLRSPSISKLFSQMGHQIPSETTCRRKVDEIANEQISTIKKKLSGVNVFLIVDESDIDGRKFLNILIGTIQDPQSIYMGDCILLNRSPDANTVASLIDDFLKQWQIPKYKFSLLLSDAAPYMMLCARNLKIFYQNLFHVTCISHLLHNCSLKIQAHFSDVNNLIAAVKMSIQKNLTRKQLFKEIGYPPDVALTRLGTWLNAALYYAKYFPDVKTIVNSFEDGGKIVANAKSAVNCNTLITSLTQLVSQYKCIAENIERCESRLFSIKHASQLISQIQFGDDVCQIKNYIDKRWSKSEISKVMNCENNMISPEIYSLLQNCPSTSCEVERSFSMMKKLLAKDRNFKLENIKNYMLVFYNKF